MGLKQYIPGTQERAERLFIKGLHGQLGSDHDGFAEIEWEDGSVSYKPVKWNSDIGGIIDDDGNFWLMRGMGSTPKDYYGVHIWHVYAGNLGVISTEAALIADQERRETVIDVGEGDEIPEDLLDDLNVDIGDGGPDADANGEGDTDGLALDAITDGGEVPEGALYDLRVPDGADGVTYSIRDPDYFDPYPVDRKAANGAAEHFARAESDGKEMAIQMLLLGLGIFAVIWLLFTIIPWLLNQIGGGGGGGGGSTVTGLLVLLAGPGLRSLLPWGR